MRKFRVLAIDGGVIRGLISTIMLQRITGTPGLENFLDSIDGFIDGRVFAGNPAVCAVAHTQDKRYQPSPGPCLS